MSSNNDDEISVTLVHSANGATETINVSRTSTTVGELVDFARALFDLGDDGREIQLVKDGAMLYRRPAPPPNWDGRGDGGGGGGGVGGGVPIGGAGIVHGDMILVMVRPSGLSDRTPPQPRQPTASRAPAPAPARGAASGGGGLDFSALLSSAGAAPAPAPSASAAASSSNSGGSGGGLTFNLASIAAAGGGTTSTTSTSSSSSHPKPVEWEGMNLDETIMRNPHPRALVEVLLDTSKHPNLMKELNYHSPQLASKMREANGNMENAAKVWREEMMKGSIGRAVAATEARTKEHDMERRLRENPMDEEANKYFGEKIRRKNVDDQYHQMMEEYPESMGRVLMLYIDAEVNGHHIQAFVDSGAQSTIMSSACAERCGLLHLLDTRFEGTAVGVGTGKILGRIHIAPLKIKGHFFPVTITVMDSEKGLGDKNMDFLFGLDMLKRHRCKIDLETNSLLFTMEENGLVTYMEAPFLHEKDLDQSKGGTRGFDADAANADLQRAIEESASAKDDKGEGNEKKGNDSGDKSDGMDVDGVSTNKKK